MQVEAVEAVGEEGGGNWRTMYNVGLSNSLLTKLKMKGVVKNYMEKGGRWRYLKNKNMEVGKKYGKEKKVELILVVDERISKRAAECQ